MPIEELIKMSTGKQISEVVSLTESVIYVESLDRLVIEGNTYLYIRYNGDTYILKLDLANAAKALEISVDKSLKVKYYDNNGLKMIGEFE